MKITDDVSGHLLDAVVELGKKNSSTLGLLPRGAYEDAASRKQILVAIGEDGAAQGYLLYRVAKTQQRASITHLCVDEEHRGQGIARSLVDALIQRTRHLRGISLYSRQDYASHSFWPKVGFVAKGVKPGRGKDRKNLTLYWFAQSADVGLFEWQAQKILREKEIFVVLDANVFFDLQDEKPSSEKAIAAHALNSDWLLADVAYCLTPEIDNEIARNKDRLKQRASRSRAAEYPRVPQGPINRADLEKIVTRLEFRYPDPPSQKKKRDSWDSDLRQLAYAILGNAHFFLTEDEVILKQSDWVMEQHNLHILRPSEFIAHFYEMRHEMQYQPSRLAGSKITKNRVSSKYAKEDLLYFHNTRKEPQRKFLSHIRRYLAEPNQYRVYMLDDLQNKLPAVLIATSSPQNNLAEIPVFRITRHPLALTLATHLIQQTVEQLIQDGARVIRLTDTAFQDSLEDILESNGFGYIDGSWVKIGLPYALRATDVAQRLSQIGKEVRGIQDQTVYLVKQLSSAMSHNDVALWVSLEKTLWPLKIRDASIPTVIVPIKPRWATDLFDTVQGAQTLFGATLHLVASRENVYYKSARQKNVYAPGRVLWYLLKEPNYRYSGTLRACSHVDDVEVGTPKALYSKYRRLGVYTFHDVLERAHGDIDGPVLAFRFSGTQLLPSAITWASLKSILQTKSPIQSPRTITVEQFNKICDMAWRHT